MEQNIELAAKLNDTILRFEDSSHMRNFAILIGEQIILSPTTKLTTQKVMDILKKINVEKMEEIFQKGVVSLVHLEFEEEIIYYLRITSKIRLFASPAQSIAEQAREKLMRFAQEISDLVEPFAKVPSEEEERIQQSLATLNVIIAELKIPNFESYKKLAKFAGPFKKEQ